MTEYWDRTLNSWKIRRLIGLYSVLDETEKIVVQIEEIWNEI